MEQAEHLGYELKRINDTIAAGSNQRLKEIGLTLAQVRVMVFLSFHSGSAPQKEIEEFFGVTHPTLIGILKRLESKGYITICVNEEDRRARVISLSEQGRNECEAGKNHIENIEKTMLMGFSRQEEKQLKDYIRRVSDNLSKTKDSF